MAAQLEGSAVAQQQPWLCHCCAQGHCLVRHQFLSARLSGCAGRGTLPSLLRLRPCFPGLRWGAGLQSPEQWVLGRCGFSSSPDWPPCPLGWHAPPRKREGLAQLSCVCAQLLVLFSYEMLPREGRGSRGQTGPAGCRGGSAAGGEASGAGWERVRALRCIPSSKAVLEEAGRSRQASRGELLPLPFPSFRLFRNGLSFFS